MHALFHSPLGLLMAQLIVILGASRLLGLLIRRMGQPLVVAEVMAGIMLGPSLLGLLAPGALAALFPASSMPLLGSLSQVGLLLFMFLIGLELDPRLLKGRGHASVLISHSSIIVPFALGAAAGALWLYGRLSPEGVPFSSFVLFMGVAMSITAFPVLARILSERRMMKSRVGAIAITCAAVDDVTAWCLLAFVVSAVKAHSALEAGVTTLLAAGYVALMVWVARPFLARLAARVAGRAGLTQGVVALTLLLLLVSASLTEAIGIHALFGAFLFGAIVPKEGGLAEALAEKLEDVAVVLLLPIFFAYSGLRTQLGLLDSAESWAMCGVIILLACLGKFGGSTLAARYTGMRWREASAIGVLMNTRGLMELVALNIGLDLGVISPTLFTMMVVMALVTTVMTTPLLHWLYPAGSLAAELEPELATALATSPAASPATSPAATPAAALALSTATSSPTPAAPARVKAGPAAHPPAPVLLCVSHAQVGRAMVTLGRALTGTGAAGGGALVALHLVSASDRASFQLQQREAGAGAGEAEDALAPLLDRAEELGAAVRPLSFVSSEPAEDICRVAEAKGAGLILLGWHKPLWSQTRLGGVVHEVLREARGPHVGVLVDRGLEAVRRVLVPFGGTPHDRAALALAQRLVRFAGAQVTVLHVTPAEGGARGVRREVEDAFAAHPEGPGRVHLKVVGHARPGEAALAEARAGGYDLVLVGFGEEWGVERRLFGLLPERFLQDCPVSLLAVRGPERAAAAATPSPAAEEAAEDGAPFGARVTAPGGVKA
jgi:Kef-type K+ transport system membrane component KefB